MLSVMIDLSQTLELVSNTHEYYESVLIYSEFNLIWYRLIDSSSFSQLSLVPKIVESFKSILNSYKL